MIVGVNRQHYRRPGPRDLQYGRADHAGRKLVRARPHRAIVLRQDAPGPVRRVYAFRQELALAQSLSPLGSSSSSGERPKGFHLEKYLPGAEHLLRDGLAPSDSEPVGRLAQQGMEPRILVNVTNDGWFWGSSELEQHLACGVFRTVECRLPMVIAANTGISAAIDASGRILATRDRRGTKMIVADVRLDRRESWYLRHGDWFAGICLAATVLLDAQLGHDDVESGKKRNRPPKCP